MKKKYAVDDLISFISTIFCQAGLSSKAAQVVAKILVEGEIMGHASHGLRLFDIYLKELADHHIEKHGDPQTIVDNGHFILWDGRYLPGPWLIDCALDGAIERVKKYGLVTYSIRRSHHIAALIAYLMKATNNGLFVLLMCSDPNGSGVTPYGGRTPLYTANPIAAGIPTDDEPLLIDVSMSTVSYGLGQMTAEKGVRFADAALIDNNGKPSDDPAVLFTQPPGAILPLGGVHYGYKGFAMGLLVEIMTSALCGGMGRSDNPGRWGANVFMQIIDPHSFGGRDHFIRESSWLVDACKKAAPAQGFEQIRLPGAQALASRKKALQHGVELPEEILKQLKSISKKTGVPFLKVT